jgi:transcriptional regulator with XRE-family HTH domain
MEKKNSVRALLAMNLRRARQNMKLSQLSLAMEVEMAHNFINNIEHSRKWVSPESMQRICDALGIQPYQLFLPEKSDMKQKDEAVAECCNEILRETSRVIKDIRRKHLG